MTLNFRGEAFENMSGMEVKSLENKMENESSDIEIEDEDDLEEVRGHQQTCSEAASEATEAVEANKLGFSIATIMGFMKSGKTPHNEPKKAHCSEEDLEEIAKAKPDLGHLASSQGQQRALQADEAGGGFPAPPKLWRPQPFREFTQQSTKWGA